VQTLRKILDLLTPHERKHAGLLLSMIMVMALLDMLGVASIMPFIAVLTNPDLVETNAILKTAYTASSNLGVDTPEQFLLLLGVLVFLLLLTSLAFKALTTFAQTRFALMHEYIVAKRLVDGFLHQPYSWFLNRHSADLGKTILSEVVTVVSGCITPLMTIMSQSAITLAILILLLLVDPLLAFIIGVVLGLAYASIFAVLSGWLKRLGQGRTKANRDRFVALSDAFGAAKEIKVGGLEKAFVERFSKPAEIYAKGNAAAKAIAQLPRFALEGVAFGGMLFVTLFLMARSGGFASAAPLLALYAFAGYRLMPALQQIYGAFSQLRFALPALDALHNDFISLQGKEIQSNNYAPLLLSHSIELTHVSYTYPNASYPALKDIDLKIPVRSSVGFVGTTGSGKTTTVDVILGLLEPQGGCLSVDGQNIFDGNCSRWQRTVGYVPQTIYLADDSVSANIAFGENAKDIDQETVERVAKIANLHEFVVNNLPQGYDTKVGERGVRLSGGQRQRIGIARALYHDPQVLILDEATSALDIHTERAVMEAVHNLGNSITTILIAHRLSTVRQCDQICVFEDGVIVEKGTFDFLTQANTRFRSFTDSDI